MGKLFAGKIKVVTISILAILGLSAFGSTLHNAKTIQPETKVQPFSTTLTVTPTVSPTNVPTPTLTPTLIPLPTQKVAVPSCNKYYINSDGQVVCSPEYFNSPPSGATAICGDGTYSFSQSRRGTCSHHGGVSQWL